MLQKLFKTLFRGDTVRAEGSLPFYKNHIWRENVNGKVKGRFQAHFDFIVTVTEALILELAMTLLGWFSTLYIKFENIWLSYVLYKICYANLPFTNVIICWVII